ncbi:MAG TPA: hypothetical protein VFB01_11180 [Burkholderiales bacterium]|nr:hypothetical protein [Burkholderiales bacterium]
MRIYLLVPLHTSDPIWMFSVQREAVQVIAPSETEARLRASLRYGRRRTREGAVSPRDPWLDAKWVYAHVIERTDAAMPVLAWEPVPVLQSASRSEPVASLLQRPDEPRDDQPRD